MAGRKKKAEAPEEKKTVGTNGESRKGGAGEWISRGYDMAGYRFGYCQGGEDNGWYVFLMKRLPDKEPDFAEGKSSGESERKELLETAGGYVRLLELLQAVEEDKFLTLSPELFSDKVLKELYDAGAFLPTRYNNYSPKEDYSFLVRMLHAKGKHRITWKQQGKIAAILINSIKPYLKRQMGK